jgi:hypothetical protein
MARRPPQPESQFRLSITPHYDPVRQRSVTRVVLETAQRFASFAYEISVEERREDASFVYRVLGLNAPGVGLPGGGTARFLRDYEGLEGTYSFAVVGLDGVERRCSVAIDAHGVRRVSGPTGTGLSLVTGGAA